MTSAIWFFALVISLLGVQFVFPVWMHLIGAFSTFLVGIALLASRSKLIDHRPSATDASVGAQIIELIVTGISVSLYVISVIVLMESVGYLEPIGQRFRPENINPELAAMAGGAMVLGIVIYVVGNVLISAHDVRRQDRLVDTMTPRELEKLRDDLSANRRGTRKASEP